MLAGILGQRWLELRQLSVTLSARSWLWICVWRAEWYSDTYIALWFVKRNKKTYFL